MQWWAIFLLAFSGTTAAFLWWVVKSIKVVGGKETGLILRFGKPVRVVGSGLCFVPYKVCKLVLFPTDVVVLDYGSREMLTAPGEWPPGSGQTLPGVKAAIDITVEFYWPRKGDVHPVTGEPALIEAYRTLPPPTVSASTLAEVFFDAILGILRQKVAQTPPAELIWNRGRLQTEVLQECLTQPGNPIREAGLERMLIVIEEIRLPKEFEETLPAPQIAALRRRARREDAKAEAAFVEEEARAFKRGGAPKWLASILTALRRYGK